MSDKLIPLRFTQSDVLLDALPIPGIIPDYEETLSIGWHTFRFTYSTMLIANGENVIQELMRHADSRCTLDVYSQARVTAKREAQRRLTQMILRNEESKNHATLKTRKRSLGRSWPGGAYRHAYRKLP